MPSYFEVRNFFNLGTPQSISALVTYNNVPGGVSRIGAPLMHYSGSASPGDTLASSKTAHCGWPNSRFDESDALDQEALHDLDGCRVIQLDSGTSIIRHIIEPSLETTSLRKLDNYQNFTKAFRVSDYRARATARGVFGDPDRAPRMALKKWLAAVACGGGSAGTIDQCGKFAICRAQDFGLFWNSKCDASRVGAVAQ